MLKGRKLAVPLSFDTPLLERILHPIATLIAFFGMSALGQKRTFGREMA
jgi:hypothetical protein